MSAIRTYPDEDEAPAAAPPAFPGVPFIGAGLEPLPLAVVGGRYRSAPCLRRTPATWFAMLLRAPAAGIRAEACKEGGVGFALLGPETSEADMRLTEAFGSRGGAS